MNSLNKNKGLGFYRDMVEHIPVSILIKSIKRLSLSGAITDCMCDEEIQTLLVNESIQQVSYEEFKQLAPFLFWYKREEIKQSKLLVESVSQSRECYQELKQNASVLFS